MSISKNLIFQACMDMAFCPGGGALELFRTGLFAPEVEVLLPFLSGGWGFRPLKKFPGGWSEGMLTAGID